MNKKQIALDLAVAVLDENLSAYVDDFVYEHEHVNVEDKTDAEMSVLIREVLYLAKKIKLSL